jgi:hypothetical protein
MALISNIVIDLAAATAVLTCTDGGSSVDVLTYANSNQQVTFSSRPTLTIPAVDFINFANQIQIFQTAILFNFHANVGAILPFSQMDVSESHPSGAWNLLITQTPGTDVCNYSATLSGSTVAMKNRPLAKTLDFPEWMVYLNGITHYAYSVKNYFNL